MSEADRNKWDTRYREGAYSGRPHPAAIVAEYASRIPDPGRATAVDGPRALDLACGAGRNALYLAGLGYRVDALDVSSEALARGKQAARETGLSASVSWIGHDLDHGLPGDIPDYDLIIIVRYLDLSLVEAAAGRLRPGGHLLCEMHLESDEPVAGPRNPAFRARPGELRRAAGGLEIVEYREGIIRDPDGRPVSLARLLARVGDTLHRNRAKSDS